MEKQLHLDHSSYMEKYWYSKKFVVFNKAFNKKG